MSQHLVHRSRPHCETQPPQEQFLYRIGTNFRRSACVISSSSRFSSSVLGVRAQNSSKFERYSVPRTVGISVNTDGTPIRSVGPQTLRSSGDSSLLGCSSFSVRPRLTILPVDAHFVNHSRAATLP